MLKNIHVIWASLMRAFRIGRTPPYEILTENSYSSTSELTVLVCVDGLDGRSAGLPPRQGLPSLGWLLLGRPSHTSLSSPDLPLGTMHRNLDPWVRLLALSIPLLW